MYHTLLYLLLSTVAGATTIRRDERPLRAVQDLPCPDGTLGQVNLIQEETQNPFQPAIYVTECLPSPPPNGSHTHAGADSYAHAVNANTDIDVSMRRSETSMEKRQINMCSLSCINTCSWDSSGPASSDCTSLTNYLQSRGSSFTVGAWQRVTATSASCMTTFLNLQIFSVTWCDSSWASQAGGLSSSCSSGGTCLGLLYEVQVDSNPDYTPPPPQSPTTNVVNNPPATTASTPIASPSPTSNPVNGNGSPDGANTAVTNVVSNVASNSVSPSVSGSKTAGVNVITTSGIITTVSGSDGIYFATGSISITTLPNGSIIPLPTSNQASHLASACTHTNSDGDACSPTVVSGLGTGKSKPLTDNPGAIAAVIIGILVLMALFIILLVWRRRRNREGQVVIVDLGEEERVAENEKARSSYRAYTISDRNSAGFGRLAQTITSPSSPRSPVSIRVPMSPQSPSTNSNFTEVPVAYVPFWDLLPGGQLPPVKGTVSELGLDGDGDDRSSVPSCYSGIKRPISQADNLNVTGQGGDSGGSSMEYPSAERGSDDGHEENVRYSAYSAVKRQTQMVVDADLSDVRSRRASTDEGH